MDKIDRDLLGLLASDGRLSFRELADAVSLSANAVAERVRRLRESGAIRHIRASINPSVSGRVLRATIDVKLQPGTPALEFETLLRHLPQVEAACLMTGSFDYVVQVACAGQEELVQVTEALRQRGVQETHTRVLLREVPLPARV